MSQSQMRRRFALLKEEGQSFTDYCRQEIETCKEQLAYALEHASKDRDGEPVFYTIARHVSRSGMSRTISIHYFDTASGGMRHLNYIASVLLDRPMDPLRDGVICRGCGMDMGFELVYELGRIGTGDGYAVHHQWL